MKLPLLDAQEPLFPNTATALDHPDGLLAAGGNLAVETLLSAYQKGIFPWYEQGQPILWWSPSARTVLYPADIHISKSLRKMLRQKRYRITTNTVFNDVIRACAEPRAADRENTQDNHTWISQEMIAAYEDLHQQGHAHSVEYWLDDELKGGLYGLVVGDVFCGESMFSRSSSASKVAFAHLASGLKQAGFRLIDCQIENDYLNTFGAQQISRKQFVAGLRKSENQIIDWPDHLISTDTST